MVGRGNMQKRRFHGCVTGAGRGGSVTGKIVGTGMGERAWSGAERCVRSMRGAVDGARSGDAGCCTVGEKLVRCCLAGVGGAAGCLADVELMKSCFAGTGGANCGSVGEDLVGCGIVAAAR
jgi:hypothetical protein